MANGVEIATGDPTLCENCGAVVSCVSTLKRVSGEVVFEPVDPDAASAKLGTEAPRRADLKAEVAVAGAEDAEDEGDLVRAGFEFGVLF